MTIFTHMHARTTHSKIILFMHHSTQFVMEVIRHAECMIYESSYDHGTQLACRQNTCSEQMRKFGIKCPAGVCLLARTSFCQRG